MRCTLPSSFPCPFCILFPWEKWAFCFDAAMGVFCIMPMSQFWSQDIGRIKGSIKNKQQSPRVETQNSLKQEVWNQAHTPGAFEVLSSFLQSIMLRIHCANVHPREVILYVAHGWFRIFLFPWHLVQILQLEKRLQDQFAIRCALGKALGSGSSFYERNEPASISKVDASASLLS